MKSIKEFNEMKAALKQTPGAQLESDLLALKRSLRVFEANCDELLGLLSTTDDPLEAMRLWDLENREGFNRFLDETERLFHNVLAAAMSLREHSYRVLDDWLPPAEADTLREEYDERVRQVFAESRAAELMKGLRVIVQHRKLPGLLGGLEQVVGGPLKSTVHVDPTIFLSGTAGRPPCAHP